MVTVDPAFSSAVPPARPASAPPLAPGAADPGETGLDALTLGRRIRDRRHRLGLTLDTLAAAVDRAPSQISMIENGKREPRLSMLRLIAAALDTSVDELLRTDAPT